MKAQFTKHARLDDKYSSEILSKKKILTKYLTFIYFLKVLQYDNNLFA